MKDKSKLNKEKKEYNTCLLKIFKMIIMRFQPRKITHLLQKPRLQILHKISPLNIFHHLKISNSLIIGNLLSNNKLHTKYLFSLPLHKTPQDPRLKSKKSKISLKILIKSIIIKLLNYPTLNKNFPFIKIKEKILLLQVTLMYLLPLLKFLHKEKLIMNSLFLLYLT